MVKSYYDKHFSHLEIVSLDNMLNVEVASGHSLPYFGYVQFSLLADSLGLKQAIPGLILVVEDTEYGKHVPVILGTNVLSSLNSVRGKLRVPTVWHAAFRTMTLTARRFRRNKGRIATLHCKQQITIPSNGITTLECYPDHSIHYSGTVTIEPINNSHLPEGIEILPMLRYHQHVDEFVSICIANHNSSPVTLQSKALCAQMQAANVMPVNATPNSDSDNSGFNFDFSNISSDETSKACELLKKWNHVFSKSDTDVGFTDAVYHRIELLDERPFKQRYRRIPPAMVNEVKDHLQQLCDAGIIRPSQSSFSSNLVLARKKDGSLRLCVDYRQLNGVTRTDSYALPRINEIFDFLAGSQFFSVLDMKSGYHQVPVHPEDVHKTAFTAGPLGHWEFCRLPFGLTNSPATYQRLMESVFTGMHLDYVQIYLDDIIVHSSSFSDHIDHLEAVFQRLAQYNLKLAPKKCKLFQTSVKYLGHVVSASGVSVDPEKTDKITSWPVPTNVTELHKFMGFANYYRRYISGFAEIAQPLTRLLRGPNSTRRRSKKVTPSTWTWQQEQQDAFDRLKYCLTHAPVLAFADGNLPYQLHIDGSRHALGAILYQTQQGVKRVIAYGSRTLSESESCYPAHKLEFLALKWAITDKFHDYLYGSRFTVFTDSNPLTYVLTTAKLDATGHRWLAALAAYQFDIVYRSGRTNVDADALSRLPETTDTINQNVISSICQMQHFQPWAKALSIQTQSSNGVPEEPLFSFTSASFTGWKEAQRNDPGIGPLFPFVAQKLVPDRKQVPDDCHSLLRHFDKLSISNGALYRVITVNEEPVRQILLPKCLRTEVLQQLHDKTGHMGRDRTLHLVKERFFWPGMTKDVESYVSRCMRCIQRKTPVTTAPLVPISTTQPLEVVSMDHLSLEPSKGGFQHILVMTDLFTRYAVAVPVRNLSTSTTAKAFVENFVVHYGIPMRILSDQGGAFESKLVKELCQLLNISKSRTTPYHPQGNPTERFNRSLLTMLGTLHPHQKLDWKSQIAPLVHAYNCTPHSSTDYSPYFLMFGRHPNLPIDVAMGIDRSGETSSEPHHYVARLRSRLQKAYNLARQSSESSKVRHKQLRDVRCRAAVLQKGDRVLVKKLAFTGKHKLADRWEPDVYIVVEQPNPNIPVYVVQSESKTGVRRCKRTLHRNHLLPVGELLSLDNTSDSVVDTAVVQEEVESNASEHDDSDDDELHVMQQPAETTDAQPGSVEGAAATEAHDEVRRTESPDHGSETDTADEVEEETSDRRYPDRDRRPPDWYHAAMSHSTTFSESSKKLEIVHDCIKFLSKVNKE
jgi:transposase InsO family protein